MKRDKTSGTEEVRDNEFFGRMDSLPLIPSVTTDIDMLAQRIQCVSREKVTLGSITKFYVEPKLTTAEFSAGLLHGEKSIYRPDR